MLSSDPELAHNQQIRNNLIESFVREGFPPQLIEQSIVWSSEITTLYQFRLDGDPVPLSRVRGWHLRYMHHMSDEEKIILLCHAKERKQEGLRVIYGYQWLAHSNALPPQELLEQYDLTEINC